jgi:hypothetical protein
VASLAGQVCDEWFAWGAHVRHDKEGIGRLSLVFDRVRTDPDLVLRIGL